MTHHRFTHTDTSSMINCTTTDCELFSVTSCLTQALPLSTVSHFALRHEDTAFYWNICYDTHVKAPAQKRWCGQGWVRCCGQASWNIKKNILHMLTFTDHRHKFVHCWFLFFYTQRQTHKGIFVYKPRSSIILAHVTWFDCLWIHMMLIYHFSSVCVLYAPRSFSTLLSVFLLCLSVCVTSLFSEMQTEFGWRSELHWFFRCCVGVRSCAHINYRACTRNTVAFVEAIPKVWTVKQKIYAEICSRSEFKSALFCNISFSLC